MKLINNTYYQHSTALVYGDVSIEEGSSLWPYSVMRAENNFIKIGSRVNIQDFVMIHVGEKHPVIIGNNTSITHRVTIHGAKIGNNCLIGIGAILMDGCEIGDNSIVAPGSVVKENTIIEPNSIVVGYPAKRIKSQDNSHSNLLNAIAYLENAKGYTCSKHRIWSTDEFIQKISDLKMI